MMQATRKEDGVVIVEFALVLPVLATLLVGMLHFGLAMNAKIDETHLTAAGARYAVVNQNPGAKQNPVVSLQNYVRNQADTSTLKTGQVCVTFPAGTSRVGDPVKVTMTKSYSFAPILKVADVAVSSEATMRLEALPTNYAAGCST